ncbi:hypothetical protein E2562_010558 [Oryza meyeriana var. granulata]|uniref:Uncharacterized protein n=1 Tax=Oryza meyeriana var. granulata TaxID=110450 RepID=A0A6G1BV97_9ORYZ|nr:hypothetical protein E2562_010558 [Oryza meyeriana var. granulata]
MAIDEPPPTLGPTGQGPLAHVALADAPTTPPHAPVPRQTCHAKALAIAATAAHALPEPLPGRQQQQSTRLHRALSRLQLLH